MSSMPAPRASNQVLKIVLVLAGLSFATGIIYADRRDETAKHDAANKAVLDHADSTLASAFSHWTETIPSVSELTPALVLDGASSVIIAIEREQPQQRFFLDLKDAPPTWAVLARSQGGRYFVARFTLDTEAAPESAHSGWRRLIANSAELIESKRAKDWLYRRGLRKEYQNEFHEAPPPEQIDG